MLKLEDFKAAKKRVDEVREDNRVITLDEDIKSKLKQYLSEIKLTKNRSFQN